MKKEILIIPVLLLATFTAGAQSIGPSTLNASGGTAVIASNEYDWSIGEMTMVTTLTLPGLLISQGVLQPSDAIVGVQNTVPVSKLLKVYPNPATTVVNLEYTSAEQGILSYKLMDVLGKVVVKQSFKIGAGTTTEQIAVKDLAAASYMLEVSISKGDAAPSVVTYKIQKLK